MDIVAIILGFIIGVVVVLLSIELAIKKPSGKIPKSKSTNKWDIGEIANPKIIAEYLMDDIDIPKNSKVIVNQYRSKDNLSGITTKEHKGIRGNYIIGDDRALILSGPMKKDEVGFWTVEKEIVEKLNEEFNEKWNEAQTMKFEEKK